MTNSKQRLTPQQRAALDDKIKREFDTTFRDYVNGMSVDALFEVTGVEYALRFGLEDEINEQIEEDFRLFDLETEGEES